MAVQKQKKYFKKGHDPRDILIIIIILILLKAHNHTDIAQSQFDQIINKNILKRDTSEEISYAKLI